MIRVAPLIAALVASLGGCGRVGYEPLPAHGPEDAGARPTVGEAGAAPRDAAVDARPLPTPADTGADGATPLEAGAPPTDRDMGSPPSPPVDAAPADAAVPGPEGGGPATDTAAPVREDARAGAPADAPASPGSTDGRPAGALACRTRHPDAVACWDFDDHAIVLPTSANGQGTRDPARAAAGPASLRVVTNGGSVVGYDLGKAIDPPITTGSLYLRAHFFMPSTTTIAEWLVPMEVKTETGAKASLDLSNNNLGLHVSPTPSFGGPLPRDRWFCAEIQIDVDRRTGSGRLFVDGALRTQLRDVDTLHTKGYNFFRVGAIASEKNGPLEYWIDEVLVTRAPVGCP